MIRSQRILAISRFAIVGLAVLFLSHILEAQVPEQTIFRGTPEIIISNVVLSSETPVWIGLPVPQRSRIEVDALEPATQKPLTVSLDVQSVQSLDQRVQFWRVFGGKEWTRKEPVDLKIEASSDSRSIPLTQAALFYSTVPPTREFTLMSFQTENAVVIPKVFSPRKENVGLAYYLPVNACVMVEVRDTGNKKLWEKKWIYKERNPHFALWNGKDEKGTSHHRGVYTFTMRYAYEPLSGCNTLGPNTPGNTVAVAFSLVH